MCIVGFVTTLKRSMMTADEAIGVMVNDLMFRNRVSRKRLGEAIGMTGQGVSRKVLGQVAWTINDLYLVADFFSVPVESLLPRRVESPSDREKSPSSEEKGDHRYVVAGAGFEPTTSGLEHTLAGVIWSMERFFLSLKSSIRTQIFLYRCRQYVKVASRRAVVASNHMLDVEHDEARSASDCSAASTIAPCLSLIDHNWHPSQQDGLSPSAIGKCRCDAKGFGKHPSIPAFDTSEGSPETLESKPQCSCQNRNS